MYIINKVILYAYNIYAYNTYLSKYVILGYRTFQACSLKC